MNNISEDNQNSFTDEDIEHLDADLIDEMNDLYDIEEDVELDTVVTGRSSVFFKLVGFVTVIAFILLIAGHWLQLFKLPSLNFLIESGELAKRPTIKEFQKAVVSVTASGRKGTGFNIRGSGLVVTNYHIIKESKDVSVTFPNETVYMSQKLMGFPEIDLAVIDIDGKNLPVLELERERQLGDGEEVFVIGNPLGFDRTVIKGMVVGRTTIRDWDEEVLMIKGPIYSGNSGSPVINNLGRVTAVIFATMGSAKDDKNEVIGLAIPIDYLLRSVEG